MKRSDRHCSPDELIDLAEGVRRDGEVPHLSVCPACRRELDEVRQALEQARMVPVPEPSPLFWDHLSARVREATAAEPHSGPAAWLVRTRWWAMLPLAAAVGVVLVAMSGGERFWRAAVDPRSAPAIVQDVEPRAEPAGDDPSMALMADLASSIEPDDVGGVGLAVPFGLTDVALAELSADERQELERLLREALGQGGA
jgi:hypothetical protein